jgi:hypothetical protein
MTLAAIVYDAADGTPMMIVSDVTDQQLQDPSLNPAGSARIVMPMALYRKLAIGLAAPGQAAESPAG